MENKDKIVRAADYIPTQEQTDAESPDSFQLTKGDNMLMSLFGDMPSYSDPKMEDLWQEIHKADEEEVIAYCLSKGVDIRGEDGEPVDDYIDITVMLKAIDRGWIKRNE